MAALQFLTYQVIVDTKVLVVITPHYDLNILDRGESWNLEGITFEHLEYIVSL